MTDCVFSRRDVLVGLSAGIVSSALPAHAAGLQQQAKTYLDAYRAEKRRGPLVPDKRAIAAARTQCRIMIANGRIGHRFGPGTHLKERLRDVGIAQVAAAENVAMGQPDVASVMAAWMKSRGHRRNILDRKMKHFGLAVEYAGGQPWWTLVLTA